MLAGGLWLMAPAQAGPVARPESVEVYFSPQGGCVEAIVREIGAARQSILVQAYSFTSAPIAKALVAAARSDRKVKIEVILDRSQRGERYSSADFLVRAGIATYIDEEHAIAHNKVMVIDGRTVLTGSYNFTKAAEEKNAENLLILRGVALAREYERNWQEHREHAIEYQGKQ